MSSEMDQKEEKDSEDLLEEEIECPDDYLVDGIFIDWKEAFEFHRKVNKLRREHRLREV